MKPVLQLALDFINIEQALRVAREAAAGGVDWLEAGTPLIKSEGLDAVRRIKREFPEKVIVADMKVMDAGRIEVESAAKAGADVVDVLGQATNETIEECIEAGRHFGAKIVVDLIAVPDPVARAREIAELGPDYITVHTSIDEQMQAKTPFETLSKIASIVEIPIGVAGGINSESCVEAIDSGAEIIIVGGAISKSPDAKAAAAEIKKAITEHKPVKSEFYRRVDASGLRETFLKVSTPNISDAMHRKRELEGLLPVCTGSKMAGPAFTVRTAPGDWSKPVAAIDMASEGDVLVIDAGGVPPAIWGELATHSAQKRNLAGVVVNGAVRDTAEIKELAFPTFARFTVPAAGEPKGFGEIDVPINIGSARIEPGDWLVGDDDGVIVIPKRKAVEIANRAMDVMERENRIRSEIEQGGTLSSVTELLRWEKQK